MKYAAVWHQMAPNTFLYFRQPDDIKGNGSTAAVNQMEPSCFSKSSKESGNWIEQESENKSSYFLKVCVRKVSSKSCHTIRKIIFASFPLFTKHFLVVHHTITPLLAALGGSLLCQCGWSLNFFWRCHCWSYFNLVDSIVTPPPGHFAGLNPRPLCRFEFGGLPCEV